MRPIEFRLLCENKNIVGYEKWHSGNFNQEHKKDYYVSNPIWLHSKDEKYWNPDFINHRYKEQFTGLYDCDNKKIFEGDILRELPKNDFEKLNYVAYEVFYHDNDCADKHVGFQINRMHFQGSICGSSMIINFLPKYTKNMLIIGNLHQNHELLNLEK